MPKQQDTSWQKVAGWYNQLVGSEGHYYHEHVVLPGVLRLLDVTSTSRVVDLGCGQGVLAHALPPIARYLGVDKAAALVSAAEQHISKANFSFLIKDVTKPLGIKDRFTHATIILALQNMENPQGALLNAAELLEPHGKAVIVLNHPCFRIPRQSGWNVDEKTHVQYRWINRYLSALKIPIDMHPGQKSGPQTWSFHRSLSEYVSMCRQAGFLVEALEEWTSDKESVGRAAKMENRARNEFPLFLALSLVKVSPTDSEEPTSTVE